MAKDLTVGPRYDTRGLPEGYDTHKLYEYRHATVSEKANGLESFLYKLMPPSLVKSISFAIDPTARFKVSPFTITPVNRTRYRATDSVLLNRTRTKRTISGFKVQQTHWMGVTNCSSPYLVQTDNPVGTEVQQLTKQPVLPSTVKDTTRRTRLIGSDQGEFELFRASIDSPSRTVYWPDVIHRYYTGFPISDSCKAIGGSTDYYGSSWSYPSHTFAPTSAIFPLSTFNTLKSQEIAYNKALASKHVVPLLLSVDPTKRDYSLLRNAIELRDLPRSITQLRSTMENLRKVFDTFGRSSSTRDLIFDLRRTSKDIPKEYVGFHFGWRQTYKDLVELLSLPEKISKKINFLLRRSGKATTYRVKRSVPSRLTGVSGFAYDSISNFEFSPQSESYLERMSEIRLVVNAVFDFPPVNEPLLQRHRFYDRIGLNPRFIDVYNLTPWTWLFDWFTGCGQYLELIESINRDNKLFNWGMITVKTNGKLVTEYRSRTPSTTTIFKDGSLQSQTIVDSVVRHSSTLEYECQTRQDVGAVYDVNQTRDPGSLSDYQYSIIGAILAQRIGRPIR
ncbi:maturation protein [ssRNA phage SRR6960549_5]|uniref:Maturation protein n=1 Tax=ssRNA phage SRR6960549_5 TaxID=2786542 RepID=A0A8S5L5M1_9VIRU|nr:maturation protein [ssRNA phage SRR6960549_5]DAD52586.1 TPA_asm: maturation protein [ssRNA phage SRR6960549_5]